MTNSPSQNRKTQDFDRPQSAAEATADVVKVARHSRTGAAATTTAETVEPRPGPTPAQINAKQKADAERAAPARATAAPSTATTPTTALVSSTSLTPATSSEALERNLNAWAGPAGRMVGFNGQTGAHRTLDDKVEIELPARFTGYLGATQRGFIMFNPGTAPTVCMTGIAEETQPVTRELLGNLDQSGWPISDFTGQPDDPFKFQYVFPIVSHNVGDELFLYVARGVVATLEVERLLGKWKWHPKRRLGLLPVIEINNGTYWSKRFQSDRPKPILNIVDWVSAGGEALNAKAIAAAKHAEFNDDLPF